MSAARGRAGPVGAGPVGAGRSGSRRELGYAVLLCLAGAGLALYAGTRAWAVDVTVRPAPLPELRAARTGGSLLPWLPPVAVVGLAGVGALVATRGAARRALGVLLLLAGASLAGGGGSGLAGADAPAWPALCLLGGLAVGLAGGLAIARARRWPALGTRYEKPVGARPGKAAGGMSDRPGSTGAGAVASTRAWDALDRGEDPTLR